MPAGLISTPSPSRSTVINKYKRRRFQKTKNLLTGETEADPEMIKVRERSSRVRGLRLSAPAAMRALLAPPPSCCLLVPLTLFSSKWGWEAELPLGAWEDSGVWGVPSLFPFQWEDLPTVSEQEMAVWDSLRAQLGR